MVVAAFFILAALVFVYAMTAPKPNASIPNPMEAGNVKVPTAEAGADIPVLFGTRRIQNPNCVWWGDVKTEEIIEEVETGGGGGIFGF